MSRAKGRPKTPDSPKPPRTEARLAHLHPLLRGARLHLRLLVSFAVAIASLPLLAMLLPAWALSARLLCAWNVAVGLYLVLTVIAFSRSDVGSMRRRAAEDDEGAVVILFLAAAIAVASLAAIVAELAAAKAHPETQARHLILALATIILSWIFTHTIFAVHYADEHYDETAGAGLDFPGDESPDYWDFLYFSLVIGMTCQVSDVAVARRSIRRTVSAHGAFSFFFNTAILALGVNFAASVI
jgi:uncharacterized membrane protein